MSVSRRQPIHAHQFEHHSSLAKHVPCWVRTEYEPQDTGQSEGPSSSTRRQCLAPGSIGGFRLSAKVYASFSKRYDRIVEEGLVAKHGVDAMDALTALNACAPWMPPTLMRT